MTALLDKYGRMALDVATASTALGFAAAKAGTRLGFGITRGIAASAAELAGGALDLPFGGRLGAGPTLGAAVSSAISYAENLALLPLLFGESLTSASLVAASTSLDALATLFPGSDDAAFSLASFVSLVRREWNEPALGEHLPETRFGVAEIAQALVAWGALQTATYDWQVERWRAALREIPFHDDAAASPPRARTESRVSITSDRILGAHRGQLLTADITDLHPDERARRPTMRPLRQSERALKRTLRRLSKMVLAGYGGASLLFFGVPLAPPPNAEEAALSAAVDASEAPAPASSSAPAPPRPAPYSWWDVLLGRHDREIFLQSARAPGGHAVIGAEERMPRYWVLTDHGRRQIVLVFRGTMSLNELAVDLTCEPEEFEPACAEEDDDDEPGTVHGHAVDGLPSGAIKVEDFGALSDNEASMPGGLPFPSLSASSSGTQPFPFPRTRSSRSLRMRSPSFQSVATFRGARSFDVHGGMLQMARMMGQRGGPVHTAVRDALRSNRGYELVMCGHSLGSGVAALLGMMWADPSTCLTVRSSGLPIGRRVSVYCFGPPCLTDARLSAHSANLITSFVYSHDVVSRLSLGSMRDMNRAAAWLCAAQAEGRAEGYAGLTRRALKARAGFGADGDAIWFLSVRKTLEANMPMAHLYPPGRVMWAIRRSDIESQADALRLFEVTDVERAFGQIVFSRDMLSAHMPHQYDKVLEELL
ncbi:hypothetical protein K488DRAFT_80930 [Vararia minispora EC-137]|uniref:Uncharacterized protein n=1 Tax=Vararia minispora EC-137 TaxID=1314806 RepID=A0ACB8Q814_9AGAM|nr:hypothetical protein K488DRAFT_80930 [Vararia minispora EC-137]